MSLAQALLLVAAGGLVTIAASTAAMRASGARLAVARRLAGPREIPVGRLLDPDAVMPSRPVRVVGRIRCRAPLHLPGGERLVAWHRDIEVRGSGGWRAIERLRESRSFELWDHDGSLAIDPANAAEPLISIPAVWHGSPDELEEPHAASAARLAERIGPLREARATTHTINVTDRLLVLALPLRMPDGRVVLEPPTGGYLVTNLALDDAMRLLGGRRRRLVSAAVAGYAIGAALVAVGVAGALLSTMLSA
jgi:hypothetical protein